MNIHEGKGCNKNDYLIVSFIWLILPFYTVVQWKARCTYCKLRNFREGLFSRNFADVKFRENKILTKLAKSLPLTDVGKSLSSQEFLTSQICLLTLFTKMTFSGKFLNIHYNAFKNELKIEFDNNDLMSGCPLVRKNLDFFEVRDFCKMVS